MMDIVIFDVELGQCVFFHPRNNKPEYGLMVDCGNTPNFKPINKILEWNWLSECPTTKKRILKNLTLTNYDQDHFSGLPYLRQKVHIETTYLAKNISSKELEEIKVEVTTPIKEIIKLKNEHTETIGNWQPPYEIMTFYLQQADFPWQAIDTNKLSQMVFLTYNGVCICIPGDLRFDAWEKHLLNNRVIEKLKQTQILIASHHGREDGYNEHIFSYSKPEVIILSDADIIHKTQEGQTRTYAGEVKGNGIILNANKVHLRKVLTMRNDGHIWIQIGDDGSLIYQSFP